MNHEPDIERLGKRLSERSPREASAAAEKRLMAEFRRRRRQSRAQWAYWASAAACVILLSGGLVMRRSSPPVSPSTLRNDNYRSAMAGFIALPYAESDVPLEEAVIVRVELESFEMAALGMPLRPAMRGKIRADLLVGQDGVARAVRLVE